MPAAPSPTPPPAGARIRPPPGLRRQPPATPTPPSPLPRAPPRTRPRPPHPRPVAPRSRRCLKGPQPDFQVGSAGGPGAAGPVRMREARAAAGVTAVPTVVLETSPLRLGKAGALRAGAWVSGLRGSCLTSPRGRQERLRTVAGSRKAPARRTKPQAESGGRGAWSQHQACPDGVGATSCVSAWLCRASFFCLCAWVLRRARQWFSPPFHSGSLRATTA
ncbi:uncharacterized protein [Chlorocebus sabaeus]|uniref:uncharacterized protein isoform X2 n=1 Tax=Chlorocebus sabaeus TaxID=60711 RepID=UPI003BF9F3C5